MADPNVTLTEVDIFNVIVGDQQPKSKVITKKGPSGTPGPQGPQGDVGPQGPTGTPGANGVFDSIDAAILEMEMAFKVANLTNFKETTFDAEGLLSNLSIYTDSGKTLKLFNKDFTFVGGQLTTITLTRISDSTSLTKNFLYNLDGSLKSIESV